MRRLDDLERRREFVRESREWVGETLMSWVRIDDAFAGHRKVLPLSDAAFRLEVAALCWCNQHANDGKLTAADVRLLSGYLADPILARSAILELTAAGLWECVGDGHLLHDYMEYQPSAAERQASNEAAAKRMREYRERRNKKTISPSESAPDPVTVTGRYAVTSREVLSSRPDPGPIPARPDPVFESKYPEIPASRDEHGKADLSAAQPGLFPDAPNAALVKSRPAAGHPAKPTAAQITATATILLGELSAARCRIDPTWRPLKVTPAALEGIERLLKLKDPYTVAEIRHVIAAAEAESRHNPMTARHFNQVTTFRPKTFERFLAMSLPEASRPVTEKKKGGAFARSAEEVDPIEVDNEPDA